METVRDKNDIMVVAIRIPITRESFILKIFSFLHKGLSSKSVPEPALAD
jgi:hypothetical protein